MKNIKMDLQLFSEEPPEELKPGNPAFDAAVGKAVETALANNDKKWQVKLTEQLDAAKTEAERMAQMNADQKAEYEAKQKEEAFSKREADLTRRELRAQSVVQLSDDGLPTELLEFLNYTDAEKCQESYGKVKEAWEKANGTFEIAVNEAVEKKLAHSADVPLGGGSSVVLNPWSVDSFNLTEQGNITKNDPELAKRLEAQAKK